MIREYFEEIDRAKQPGYVSRYDDFEFEYADASREPARAIRSAARASPRRHRVTSRPALRQRPSRPNDRAQHRSDPPSSVPKPTTSEPLKTESFGAGIFPES